MFPDWDLILNVASGVLLAWAVITVASLLFGAARR